MLGLRRRAADPLKPLQGHLTIPAALWRRILTDLHDRGAGLRESGAFLLASRADEDSDGAPTVVAAAYYDDLDAACLTGGITMSGAAYDRLWQRCREGSLRVVADVHTHPGEWVGQSHIDRANPMMAWVGHVALIVGNFADPAKMPQPVGTYRYLGEGAWETLHAEEATTARPSIASRIRNWVSQFRRGMRRL